METVEEDQMCPHVVKPVTYTDRGPSLVEDR